MSDQIRDKTCGSTAITAMTDKNKLVQKSVVHYDITDKNKLVHIFYGEEVSRCVMTSQTRSNLSVYIGRKVTAGRGRYLSIIISSYEGLVALSQKETS